MKRIIQGILSISLLVLLTAPPSAAEPLTLDFPRLGMWWPDPWEQSLTDIARYDWVILDDWSTEFIAPLRNLNPEILLLTASNACELSFDPEPDAEPSENEDVLAIPPEWFLTQVGTTLTAAVNASTTQFHVDATTADDGEDEIDLFIAGDTALIEGESVLIEAVDKDDGILTVQRGYVRPASSHAAGTRIAAHITFWPESWLLDVSTFCPAVTVDSEVGPEQWADYNAREAVRLVERADWDGILLDRSDPDESWLIGNSTARSIDFNRSNALPDDYTVFDEAWNDGLRQYETAIRAGVGEKIVFVNLGLANYDLLNGNNYEVFPTDDTDTGIWQSTVIGPHDNSPDEGSYFEWVARGQDPNLTMIETYEDDEGADPTSGGEYDNRCDDPDFVPNYRKMRFGLTTALLDDGFFSYEMNTNGHGSLCLMWFDEYDNAGRGRGYLGQPRGAAYLASPALTTANLVPGSTFESSLGDWSLWADEEEGYEATASIDSSTSAQGDASVRIEVTRSQGTDWQVSFESAGFEVVDGKDYTLTFWAKADASRPLSAWVQQGQDPWNEYIYFSDQTLTTEWQEFELLGTTEGSDPAAGLLFGLGQQTGTVWLDDVRLQRGSRQVWRRDYEGGTVVVNATSDAQTVELGRVYRKIDGAQAPAVNDGRFVRQVTLPAFDGLILLNAGAGPVPALQLLLKDR